MNPICVFSSSIFEIYIIYFPIYIYIYINISYILKITPVNTVYYFLCITFSLITHHSLHNNFSLRFGTFFPCFTVLLVDRIYRRIVRRLMNNELKSVWKETVVAYSRDYPRQPKER
jgi:hypothetical protein